MINEIPRISCVTAELADLLMQENSPGAIFCYYR